MTVDKERLLGCAVKATKNAYSPYSGFKVGAAVLGDDGNIYIGANVENASYGLTVCAERTAIFGMINGGGKKIVAIAVFCDAAKSCMPCGSCRQVVSEFALNNHIPVYTKGSEIQQDFILSELLPHAFGGAFDEII